MTCNCKKTEYLCNAYSLSINMSEKELIIKPCQSGKTNEVLKNVMKIIADDENSVHILFTQNSLKDVHQLENRIQKDTKYVAKSSHHSIRWKEIANDIGNDEIKTVITCVNKSQFGGLNKLLKDKTLINKHFYIWIDEADKIMSGNLYDDYISAWQQKNRVKKICYITATVDNILKREHEIPVMDLDQSYLPDVYHTLSECEFKIQELDADMDKDVRYLDYIKKCVKDRKNGQVWFVPGKNITTSHYDIAKELAKLNMYVLTVNKDGNQFHTPSGSKVLLPKSRNPMEIIIGDLYEAKHLENHCFAIVGLLGICRGITINSKKCLITHAVFSNTVTARCNAYQLAGRVAGNIKKNNNYKKYTKNNKIKIYCSDKFRKEILDAEKIAINLIKTIKDRNGNTATVGDVKNIINKYYSIFKVETKVFKLYESEEIRTEYKKYIKTLEGKPTKYDYNKCVKESDLVQTSTTVKKKVYGLQEILDELKNWDITAGFDLGKGKKHKLEMFLEGTVDAVNASRSFPCYQDKNNKTTLCVVIRYGTTGIQAATA